MLNIEKRSALLRRIGNINAKRRQLPLVTSEEFFEGNDDGALIWCNLECAPEPKEIYSLLNDIRSRDDVADVRVMVTQYDGDDDEWPFPTRSTSSPPRRLMTFNPGSAKSTGSTT